MSEQSRSSAAGDQGAQIQQAFGDLASGLLAIGPEIDKSDEERGMHSTRQLPKPVRIAFGTYKEKLEYTAGCMPLSELSRAVDPVEVVVCNVTGSVVAIMRTPQEWNPKAGGSKQIKDAGEPGDYLMTKARADGTSAFRYLDEPDLDGVILKIGQEFQLGENMARGRQVEVPGQIINVVGYR